MVPIKGPAVPVPDDAIMASCIGTASYTVFAVHLFGIVWASRLIYKDAMYHKEHGWVLVPEKLLTNSNRNVF